MAAVMEESISYLSGIRWNPVNLTKLPFIPVNRYAKQKQPGCKKVRGQSEATMVISDQNL